MRTVIAIALWMWLGVSSVAWAGLQGCGGARTAQQDGTHTALQALADVVNPAYTAATQLCLMRQQLEVNAATAGKQTVEQSRAKVAVIREQCDKVERVFEEIRKAHQLARQAEADGQLARANQLLSDVLEQWHTWQQIQKGGGS